MKNLVEERTLLPKEDEAVLPSKEHSQVNEPSVETRQVATPLAEMFSSS